MRRNEACSSGQPADPRRTASSLSPFSSGGGLPRRSGGRGACRRGCRDRRRRCGDRTTSPARPVPSVCPTRSPRPGRRRGRSPHRGPRSPGAPARRRASCGRGCRAARTSAASRRRARPARLVRLVQLVQLVRLVRLVRRRRTAGRRTTLCAPPPPASPPRRRAWHRGPGACRSPAGRSPTCPPAGEDRAPRAGRTGSRRRSRHPALRNSPARSPPRAPPIATPPSGSCRAGSR